MSFPAGVDSWRRKNRAGARDSRGRWGAERGGRRERREPIGPLPLVKTRLKRLRPSGEVWEADARPLPEGILPFPAWLALVASETTGLVLAHSVLEEEPSANLLWDVL